MTRLVPLVPLLVACVLAGLAAGVATADAYAHRRHAADLRARLDTCAGETGTAITLAAYAEDLADRTDVCVRACVLRGLVRYGADARGQPPPGIARDR